MKGITVQDDKPCGWDESGARSNPDNVKMIMKHSLKEKIEVLCLQKTDIGRK